MPDAMDRVQQHAEDLNADALAAHQRTLPRGPGRQFCEDEACGEAMGATLCIDCQTASEARAAHFTAWRR